MTNADADNFKSVLNVTYQTFGRKVPDRELLRMWWIKLARCELIEITKAFDTWIDTSKELPTIADILELCKPKVTIHARLPSPLNIESNKKHASEIKQALQSMTSPKRDMKEWARKILANPSALPQFRKMATEALGATE